MWDPLLVVVVLTGGVVGVSLAMLYLDWWLQDVVYGHGH
jgi:multisubunit Na+/H+ antiporter MnhC subunit